MEKHPAAFSALAGMPDNPKNRSFGEVACKFSKILG
jgi:hypothetical protein